MTGLDASHFPAFYQALHGPDRSPFPWQCRLANLVCQGEWPRYIALPTASGKTTCIEIALFALACQAGQKSRTAPRRIFFVVDRRIIVAQAFDHACAVAEKLANPNSPILRDVAGRLCEVAASDRPLDCYQLRGGIYRDDSWAKTPLQPTVIASTVDQVGSRLLYRGYGLRSGLTSPIHAALTGNDSLILLDEAHCARPFGQTLDAIRRYRGWAAAPVPSPFHFVQMTGTPPASAEQVFRDEDDDREHPVLGRRIAAAKPTRLVVAEKAKGKGGRRHLVEELVRQADGLLKDPLGVVFEGERVEAAREELGEELQQRPVRAIGVIVNRIATAREVYKTLLAKHSASADVVLLIGRMRPLDRDRVVSQHLAPLLSGAKPAFERPIFVVATQCLEVGADLDFHALVSECASLDALRQRFGRLNRVADRKFAPGVIVVRADQTAPPAKLSDEDPVYGASLSRTWNWLSADAVEQVIDVGVAAIRSRLQGADPTALSLMEAPAEDAPVLFPSHLDCWVQTAPVPLPDPDPALFLHGPNRGVPDVQVIWRSDLVEGQEGDWKQIVSLCPPSSSEAMVVPLPLFRDWLRGEELDDKSSDVEGEALSEFGDGPVTRTVLRWCGPDNERTEPITDSMTIKPGDLLVVPAMTEGWELLGHVPELEWLRIDRGDEAYRRSRDIPLLRLTDSLVKAWPANVQTEMLTALSRSTDADEEDEREQDLLIDEAVAALAAGDWPPEWDFVRMAAAVLTDRNRRTRERHPMGGWVLRGRRRLSERPVNSFSDEDDLASGLDGEVNEGATLEDHCRGVEKIARQFAAGCGLPEHLVETLGWVARWHDLGKADRRFQALLRNLPRWAIGDAETLWAKSASVPRSVQARRHARLQSGYPADGRHEMLSVRLAETRLDHLPPEIDRDLFLHLMGSHHGHARPLAPVVEDGDEVVAEFRHHDVSFGPIPAATGLERLDSGVADRFWSLVRRHGWWGLAYLEAIIRLADHRRSEAEQHKERKHGD